MSLRVLYVVTAYDRGPDDVITPWLVETIDRLRATGVEVEVLAPAYRGSGDQIVRGVRVHRFRYAPAAIEDLTHDETAPDRIRRRPWYRALVPGYVASGMLKAGRVARRGGFDLVHVHWPIPHALLGFAARRAAGTPVICSFYGVELTWARNSRWVRAFARYAIRRADAVTAISSYTAGLVREIHERAVERIPFGATVMAPEGSVDAGSPDGPFELLFVGRLVERKGVRYVLEAVARLRRAGREVSVTIVGDGPLRARLEARADELGLGDGAVFTGFVGKEELRRRFQRCDAFVLPAVVDAKGDTEGLGVVLIEALAHGKPVIASRAGGIVDIVRDGETGLLVPPADPAALAGAIESYMDRPEMARRLAERGREHVRTAFSWPAIIEDLRALYDRLAGRGRGPA